MSTMLTVKRIVWGLGFMYIFPGASSHYTETEEGYFSEKDFQPYCPASFVAPLSIMFDPDGIPEHAQAYNAAQRLLPSFETCCKARQICLSPHLRLESEETLVLYADVLGEALKTEGWSVFDELKEQWIDTRIAIQTTLDERAAQAGLLETLDDLPKVYIIYWEAFDAYKIGIALDPEKRRRGLVSTQLPVPNNTKIVHVIKTDDARRLESYLHKRYAKRRQNGEWFKLDENDIAYLNQRHIWLSKSIPD